MVVTKFIYQGGKIVLSYHGDSHKKALLDLYPSIGLQHSRQFLYGNKR